MFCLKHFKREREKKNKYLGFQSIGVIEQLLENNSNPTYAVTVLKNLPYVQLIEKL